MFHDPLGLEKNKHVTVQIVSDVLHDGLVKKRNQSVLQSDGTFVQSDFCLGSMFHDDPHEALL